ncbi:MAG: hypothetical protein IPL06_18055 [Betaproteobacteria bacterium]|nr:hypothetical protein [Betaproteobacteria bacterium]
MRALPSSVLAVWLAFLPCAALPAAATTADTAELAERLLSALGGRAAWAAARATVNDSRQDWDGDPAVLRVVITMDFERPRWRIETRGDDLHLVRVVDGDRHWRLTREGAVAPVSEATLAADRRWYAGHVYRTLHRIARRDPALRLVTGADGRLEVHEGGARLVWFRLDRRGQPYRYGAHDDETGSIFGPWEHAEGGIRHPVWVSRDEGRWRAMLVRLAVNPRLDDAIFAPPSGWPAPTSAAPR